jgi:leucyl aminopeptidase
MITITSSSQKIAEQKADCFGFLLPEKETTSADIKACEKKLGVTIAPFIKAHDFSGKRGQIAVIPAEQNNKIYHIILAGLGTKKDITIENYRRAIAQLYRQANAHKVKTIALSIPKASLFDLSAQELAQQTATILAMTSYSFDDFFSKENKPKVTVEKIIACVSSADKAKFAAGIKDGEIIGSAVNKARHWVNNPPCDITPPELASRAKAIAKKQGLKFTQFSEKDIIKKGMGGLASVGRGSIHDCQLVILEYKAPKKNADTIAFVGKGITFDSGGLSLKPPVHMETMKEDMSGAAAVIAAMEALSQLKPDVNIIGVAPLAENMPGGKASHPGDIVRFYNGKTAEIKNTDAEGRLVLADALAYTAKHYKPDAIIDFATLTGACAYALGPFYTGLMSQDDDLAAVVEDAAHDSGDHVWRLPLTDDYKIAIKSEVADICNIGSNKYMAGATTAGHFLQNFVGDIPFAHLDIAGTAFNVPDRPYYKSGATGVGVRLMVDIAQHWE